MPTTDEYMHAHDRFLPEWFNRVNARQITLPRFQRSEAWGHGAVAGLLTTVLRGLPAGATLILEVGDEEKFVSRTMVDAPKAGGKVTEQLLDGQQRVTALWRSLRDCYEDRTYLIGFEESPDEPGSVLPYVYGQARWPKNGQRYPVWVDAPRECWKRGFLPVSLLRPEDIAGEIRGWIRAAIGEETSKSDERDALFDRILALRDRVKNFNLPYLALPAKTPKDVALDVFIKMNTSSVQLSTYDIVVALVEEETGESLRTHVESLQGAVPRAADYADLPGLVLDVVALRQNHPPSQAGYRAIDYGQMLQEWDRVVAGVRWAVEFLEDESVFDAQRLPSYSAVPVVAALVDHLPTHPDQLGNARHLLRKYLWRSFLSARYEQSSTTHALQDFRGLKAVLIGKGSEAGVPIMDVDAYPLPTSDMIVQADWPKRRTILGRGLLALQLKCGAEDLGDGIRASVASITSAEKPREYHHLFPASLLSDAKVPDAAIFRAANCALLTWRTNRALSDKHPVRYLKERADNAALGEPEVRHRLSTHLIPYSELAVGYDGLSSEELAARVKADYSAFLKARAEILAKAAQCACDGLRPSLQELMGSV
ncbi:MAG: DUF262 domain-containing protein [Armatimonadota bacterium]